MSCALLEIVGAAVGTAVSADSALGGPGGMTSLLAKPLADFTLIAIALGAVSANVLNIYSGALSFTAIGIRLPLALRRAIVALGFGAIGFFLAWSALSNAGTKYENFLLIIAYWIAPWLAVYFCDLLLRPNPDEALLFSTRRTNWAGPVAMLAGIVISIWLFSNQTEYVGRGAQAHRLGRGPDLRGGLCHHRRDLPGLARHRQDRPGADARGLVSQRFARMSSGKTESALD